MALNPTQGFNWGGLAMGGLGAVGNIVGGYFQGQGQKAGMQALAKANEASARMGFMGSSMALSDAQAARAGQYGQNAFGQFAGALYNTPIDVAWQRMGKEQDLSRFKPWELALERKERSLLESEQQEPLFRDARQKEAAEQVKLAGKYAAMERGQYGPFTPFIA
jgi:hypothetical protein